MPILPSVLLPAFLHHSLVLHGARGSGELFDGLRGAARENQDLPCVRIGRRRGGSEFQRLPRLANRLVEAP